MTTLCLRILICVSLVGCTSPGAPVSPSEREMALTEGTTITVYPLPHKQALHPEVGDIPFTESLKIRAGYGFRRYYTWDGATRSVDLWPRDKRWNGSLCAYYLAPESTLRSN